MAPEKLNEIWCMLNQQQESEDNDFMSLLVGIICWVPLFILAI